MWHPDAMNLGIVGSGPVGGTLGERWAKLGHNVVFATRDPESSQIRDLVKRAGATARAGSSAEAAQADVVVVTLPYDAVKSVLPTLDLRGKIVFDCTNPLKPDLSGLAVSGDTSAGEQVAKLAPGAEVVKIFNNTGVNNMADPIYHGQPAAMFYCGGDARAKSAAHQLAQELGFDPIDAGPIENARLLESMAMLWVWLAYKGGMGREIAYQLLRGRA
jgi:8-hydroxy-5-deazaflavin:NADPH oxidoreductase